MHSCFCVPSMFSGSQSVIAFSAGIAGENSTFCKGENLIFDKILTNHGDGYDPKSGIFTAPEAGVFVISTEASVSPNVILNLELMVDDKSVAEITVEAAKRKKATISRQWVLDLKEGSTVSVRALQSGEVLGQMHTSFSGWKISGGSEVNFPFCLNPLPSISKKDCLRIIRERRKGW